MPTATKRWNDPIGLNDGLRVLVCRYRPRGLPKAKETWTVWYPELGPSRGLLAAFHANGVPPISLDEYRERYLAEMGGEAAQARIRELAVLAQTSTVTLLCSRDCILPAACHRTILRELITAAEMAT